ncbi:hypothetical protein MKX01_024292 [Papaver californicum]|nr:hypothetical protein MKX01_024292 [Papaver californicum]
MSSIILEPVVVVHHHHNHNQCRREKPKYNLVSPRFLSCLNYTKNKNNKLIFCGGRSFSSFKHSSGRPHHKLVKAAGTTTTVQTDVPLESTENVLISKTFPLNWTQRVEGKISVRLYKKDGDEDEEKWVLTVGCNLPGKWVLHWGVSYTHDIGSEWDQPPLEMRPPGSIPIRDYAVETPLMESPEALQLAQQEVQIEFDTTSSISAINFVFKDEETGAWCQHRGRDFKVPLTSKALKDANSIGAKKSIGILPGALDQISNLVLKEEGSSPNVEEKIGGEVEEPAQQNMRLEAFYKEYSILKEFPVQNAMTVSVTKSPDSEKNLVNFETDLPGEVIVHWGVCRDIDKRWEIPEAPHPAQTTTFKNKALQTILQLKEDGLGSSGIFPVGDELMGLLFVLKLSNNTWLKDMGSDFYVPLATEISIRTQTPVAETGGEESVDTDEIIKEIRDLVTDISSEKKWQTKSKEAQEIILQEIEKLAAEAYGIFRSTTPTFVEEVSDAEVLEKTPIKITSGTGSGFEILCQGFNWESNKSGRWYQELLDKANELASIGFTVIWLPPPTDSVSPEGYMPRDLYNLNSRYGSMEELKVLVKKFHEVGIKVLGDAVLNHRCAQKQNQNGVWNIFGGKLNWDDRAVVADDPHFQGRGNKSSGDSFHAAPNIDHSQEFVRKDLKEWLCWLRNEIGYDGWRLDFVRGFWGGYVKDYMEASEPYFSVGEYWDSLSYSYGEMDHNQDAHRQRIIDWINAANGTSGAFDVTTKGILHATLERCEYWRLSDSKGKPPGVAGWWPSRAVTFIENHDTGSTQGHWRFPGGKEMQGYAYILTHPGTPSVFYDHIFSHYKSEIAGLISIRNRNKINCRSTVNITKAERDVYAAIIDEKVAMKIGPGHYEPPNGSEWKSAYEGRDYKVWERS